MARNSKNKKIARKNKKLRYRKGGPARLDMRKGGRVSLQYGGDPAQDYENRRRRGYGFEDRDREPNGDQPPEGMGTGGKPDEENGNVSPPPPPPPPLTSTRSLASTW